MTKLSRPQLAPLTWNNWSLRAEVGSFSNPVKVAVTSSSSWIARNMMCTELASRAHIIPKTPIMVACEHLLRKSFLADLLYNAHSAHEDKRPVIESSRNHRKHVSFHPKWSGSSLSMDLQSFNTATRIVIILLINLAMPPPLHSSKHFKT